MTGATTLASPRHRCLVCADPVARSETYLRAHRVELKSEECRSVYEELVRTCQVAFGLCLSTLQSGKPRCHEASLGIRQWTGIRPQRNAEALPAFVQFPND